MDGGSGGDGGDGGKSKVMGKCVRLTSGSTVYTSAAFLPSHKEIVQNMLTSPLLLCCDERSQGEHRKEEKKKIFKNEREKSVSEKGKVNGRG